MRPFYFALWLLLNQNCKLQSFLSFKLNFFSGYFCPSHVLTFSKTFFDKPKTLIFSPYKKCFSFLKFALWSFNLKVHNTWVSLYVAFGSANFVVLFGKNISDKNIYFVKECLTSGQSYKHFMLVNYDSRVVIWGIFQSGTTLES